MSYSRNHCQNQYQGAFTLYFLQGGLHLSFQFSSVQSLTHVQLFMTPWTAARQGSLSFTNSWSLLKLMSIKLVMPSNISSSVVPLSSCLQSFPPSGSFPVSQFFTSGGQSIGASASASVLPNKLLGNTNAAGPQTLCAVRLTIEAPLGTYRIHR